MQKPSTSYLDKNSTRKNPTTSYLKKNSTRLNLEQNFELEVYYAKT